MEETEDNYLTKEKRALIKDQTRSRG